MFTIGCGQSLANRWLTIVASAMNDDYAFYPGF
jgi:hypothetical protein